MKGEVIYLYAYDVAYEADLAAIAKTMRGAAERFQLGRPKDAPRDFPVYRPLTVQIEDLRLEGPSGPIELSVFVKFFAVGALSVKVRTPVNCRRLVDMVAFRDLRFKDNTTLDDRVKDMVARIFEEIKPCLDTPAAALKQPEVYTVFCVNPPSADSPEDAPMSFDESTEAWLHRGQREVAALLDGENDPACLSDQEVEETMKHRYSYYRHDLAVIDWDAALVVDTPDGCQDVLYVLEAANLQLAELKVYDAKLDAVLDKAYDDVEAATRPSAFRARQRVLVELREIRMDLTKVADELSNITKFFGDWHLARVYMGCDARFHLRQWGDLVGQKLRALDGLYTILQQDSMNRVMLLLEIGIVALFVIDLVIIAVQLGIK
jgi:hypothetical protein